MGSIRGFKVSDGLQRTYTGSADVKGFSPGRRSDRIHVQGFVRRVNLYLLSYRAATCRSAPTSVQFSANCWCSASAKVSLLMFGGVIRAYCGFTRERGEHAFSLLGSVSHMGDKIVQGPRLEWLQHGL
jgi:hypothetical protein